jgi:O-antigen/teichoic acid export membrane protein
MDRLDQIGPFADVLARMGVISSARVMTYFQGDGRATRPLSLSFASSTGIQALNVLTGVLLARTLGPHGRGELAALVLWPSILAAVGNLGVIDAVTYYSARSKTSVGTIVGSSLVLGVCQSAFLITVGFFLFPLVLSHYDQHALHTAYLFLVFVPINILTLNLAGAVNGLHRFLWFQGVRLMVVGATVVGLLAFAFARALTPQTAVLVYLAANLITLCTAAVLYRLADRSPLRFKYKVARELLSFGVRSHLGNVSSLLNERLDQLVISVFLAPTKLGLYVVAVTLCSLTTLVGSSVSLVALPTLARLRGVAERARAARRLVGLTAAGSAVLTLPVIAFTPLVIEIAFGSPFRSAAVVSRILLVAAVILSTNRALGSILTGIGRPLDAGIAESLALVATFAGLAALLPAFGLVGAGIASLIAYSVSSVWMIHRATKALDLSASQLLLPERRDVGALLRLLFFSRAPAPAERAK